MMKRKVLSSDSKKGVFSELVSRDLGDEEPQF